MIRKILKKPKCFLEEAGKNNPLAMYKLGRRYADGLGCEADAEESHQKKV